MTNNLDDEVKKILALPGLQIDDTDEEYMRYLEEKIIKVIRLKEKLISEEDLFALVQKEIPNFNQQYARIKENLARTNAKTDTRFGISICFELIDLFAMLDY